ncbi:alpha/beta fold hydrolase [Paraburkholderia sp. J41]|uniref:alpha/beta fold hydrolase n=1 Tax=Paraburkholderia sp. J41 TaxID=2805433 RepID=UPI002AC3719D|nr:alpha/beta fold hydrolase [Paraburkholderia sp. J41]
MAFWTNTPARLVRRGHIWIAGDRVEQDGLTYQRGPLFAEWEAPETVTQPWPVVLVHGGGYQSTEWLDTPDGRPGWQQRLVEAGYATVIVDRPGQGRSPYHVDTIGPMGPPFSYENGKKIYTPEALAEKHTQWPFDRDDEAAWDEFIAGYGPLPADLAFSQDMEADRIAKLLDSIGPAILLTHSASGPVGWLVADRRPDLVKAIVAVEPMGPPFADIPDIGSLSWGLTAAPLTWEPAATPQELRDAAPGTYRLPALANLPILAVTADASAFAAASPPAIERLKAAGAAAELMHLGDYGVHGNGHGLIYEKNSDAALAPVLAWLERHSRI